jgi:hypothetical protein
MTDKYLVGKVVHLIFYDHEISTSNELNACECWGLMTGHDKIYFYVTTWNCLDHDDLVKLGNNEVLKIMKSAVIKLEYFTAKKTCKKYSTHSEN